MLNIVDLGLSSPPPSPPHREAAPKYKKRTLSTSMTTHQSRPSPHDRMWAGTSPCPPAPTRPPAPIRPPLPSRPPSPSRPGWQQQAQDDNNGGHDDDNGNGDEGTTTAAAAAAPFTPTLAPRPPPVICLALPLTPLVCLSPIRPCSLSPSRPLAHLPICPFAHLPICLSCPPLPLPLPLTLAHLPSRPSHTVIKQSASPVLIV
ncbi:unnamed protein product [Cyclocybe aegerita]|uniref:Uncharacterized protein n=1 Tax=Cyclocybe aegerita TaxID=1973307 RepID=A0A8S0WF44_CYCAE|nr:unnamed protein product [Cyclocybe aegerita]